jgi:predicted NBD/HSP70 family sugar kinase
MTSVHERRATATDPPILVIDIGGTSIKFGYSVSARPHSFRKIFSTEPVRQGDPVKVLADMAEAAVREARIQPAAVVATVPGFIDTDGDHVLFAGNILSLNGRPLASELGNLIRCPVLLERDAILLLTGEISEGTARGGDHVLGVFFGTGIGASYMQDGKPFRGGGWALEIGSMPFRGDGRIVPGRRADCLEAYASGRTLQDIADREGEAVGSLFHAARRKPSLADELATFVRYQAFAVAGAIALFSPRTIVLGGGVLEIDGYPKDRLSELIAGQAPISETGRPMDLRWAQLGWASVLHSASRIVADHLARHPELINSYDLRSTY